MKQRIIIIGAGYAGMMTALRLSHAVRKHKSASITLINGSDIFVERIRLHQLAAGRPPKRRPIQRMLRGTGVDFMQGWVQQIKAEDNCLIVQTEQGEQGIPYDWLVYAPGSMIDRGAIPGIREHAYTLELESAQALRQRLPQIARKAGCVTVIGSGLTGIEAATEFAEQYPGLRVQMLTANTLGAAYSSEAQAALRQRFAELGIIMREGVHVQGITADGVMLTDGETIPSDAVLWAGGFVVPVLAHDSGLAVNSAGQLLINSAMRSISHPNIYGAGDASTFIAESGLPPLRLACAVAMPMGAHVADNLAAELRGEAQKTFAFSYALTCISLGKNKGLTMLMSADDSTTQQVYTGRLGGFIKNMILRYTVWSMQLERLAALYQWPRGIKASAPQTNISPAEKAYT